MTWLGTIVGIIGWRDIRNGVHVLRHARPRFPLVFAVGASQQQQQMLSFLSTSQGSLLTSTRALNNTSLAALTCTTTIHRNFWTWRGGDDKKWNWRGGDDDDDDDAMENEEATMTEAKETSANSKQPQLSPSAYPVSVCTAQGFRSYMEDEFFLSLDGDFAAVFDGHGGQAVSRYLRKNLYANVQAFLPVSTTPPPPPPTTTTNVGNLQTT